MRQKILPSRIDFDGLWRVKVERVDGMWHFQCFLVGACLTDELGRGVGGPGPTPPHNSVAGPPKVNRRRSPDATLPQVGG